MRAPIYLLILLAVLTGFVGVGPSFAGTIEEADAADRRSDYPAALKLLLPLAQRGDADAQLRMGKIYASGKGVAADHVEAEVWFRRAAAQGDLEAIWNIGQLHHRGRGNLKKDFAEGERWYLRAAERGHVLSQTTLAAAYYGGDGVERDGRAAAKWFTRAANQGDFNSQYTLGLMYENGQGVPQDRVLSYKWLSIAASRPTPGTPAGGTPMERVSQAQDVVKFKRAVEIRDRLYQEMSPSERAEGQKLAQQWRARPER